MLVKKPARKPGELAGPELATVVGCAGPPGPIPKKSHVNTSCKGMQLPAKKTTLKLCAFWVLNFL